MAATPTLDPQHLNRITRYIHTGMELPKYFPGCWTTHKYFEADKLKAIDEALQADKENVEIVNLIVKAYKDGWYTRYETIAFALTKCLMLGGELVKEAGYKAAAEVCTTPEQLMLFNKFTRLLKTGNGQGWCKSVRNWYCTKDPMELAQEVTRVRARHGRSHKTLIRKSHLKVEENDNARHAVVKYALFGLKRAKQLMANKEGTQAVFEYIQRVEDMRHCEDPAAAAAIAAENQFTLDHVPGHLLTSQEVWNAVLPQLSLGELLGNIQRIHNMGFLAADSATTAVLLSLLNNNDVVNKSKVTPLEVYITIANYKKKCRPMKHEKAKVSLEKEQRRRSRQVFDSSTGLWQWTATRRHAKEAKYWGIDQPPNQAVLMALSKLIDQTWLLTPPTGARYLITLDMRHHMFKGRHFCKSFTVPNAKKGKKAVNGAAVAAAAAAAGGDADAPEKKSKKHLLAECFYNKHVTPGHAAIIVALQLLKREKQATLAVFTDDGLQTVALEKNFTTIEEAEFVLRKANLGKVQLDAPMRWAMTRKEKYDVFINMIDRPTRYMELDVAARGGRGPGGRFGPPPTTDDIQDRCPVRALERYRAHAKMPNAKLVVMSLASHRVGSTDGSHRGVLDVVGIDEHVPKVLDAFVKGQFQ
ncbi:RNA-binding protein RO60 isoform X2 [Plutella xylostella]|uniref:RNA-binding protein RO60 isoform X1 n=1 Tax=Plutella xylostella TaxID=51655 RepID=UPI002032B397|nr:RNA-binding protein RO60 isoform X1 [Plutella xylostella]XP_048481866.1 RNA-binding protein RO60 isoform X2 [Plutella xylostella]